MQRKSKYVGSFQSEILARVYNEKAMQELQELYNSACLHTKRPRAVTKEDALCFKMWNEGLTVTEIAQRLKKKPHQVDSSINLYARDKARAIVNK